MNKAYLLTGGNIGDRSQHLSQAAHSINQLAADVITASPLYETEPWGIADQPGFLNQVLYVKTHLPAVNLLQTLLLIEAQTGRVRRQKYGPRIIDIDILFYGRKVINNSDLIIPHPEIQNRRFALVPMNDIAPEFIHPVLKKTMAKLLEECTDYLKVEKYNLAT